ncbi:hypothetical protein [Rhizobium sp. Root1220]|uniref:hypothetical protein n=1 Tax=Rhizobium sp. Root1220 TaxID=1736432 RepID=UPI000701702F|nr:hypothetical protein [Rhizobium sp. Root1220]KQV78104.1 hypothetical protein ASC90_27325 [Rhizobium sp. Root1220]
MPTIRSRQIDQFRRERETHERRCDEIRHDLDGMRQRRDETQERQARERINHEIAEAERSLKEHEKLARAHGEMESALTAAALADPTSRQQVMPDLAQALPFIRLPLELRVETIGYMRPQDVVNLRTANQEAKTAVDAAILKMAEWRGFVDAEERVFDPQSVQQDPGRILALWAAERIKITSGPQLEAYDEHLTDDHFRETYTGLMDSVLQAGQLNVFPDVMGGPIDVAKIISPFNVAHIHYLHNEERLEWKDDNGWCTLPSDYALDAWQIITRIVTGEIQRRARS